MTRKAFVVNEVVREKVRHLAGVGVRQDDIAKIIGCAPKTLRKRRTQLSPDRTRVGAKQEYSRRNHQTERGLSSHKADLAVPDMSA